MMKRFLLACAALLAMGSAVSQTPATPNANTPLGKMIQAAIKKNTAPPPKEVPGIPGQPVIVHAPVEKCIECKGTVKKRIAVLPTRVGTVAGDAGASPEIMASVVSERLETRLRSRPEFLVLGRSNLQDVLAEQDLGAKGITNAELTPHKGRVIPAELMLQMTLDRVDITVDTRRQATSDAAARLQRAHQLENAAIQQREYAAGREADAVRGFQDAQQMHRQNEETAAQTAKSTTRGGLNLGLLAAGIGGYAEGASMSRAQEALNDAKRARSDAERKLLAARQEKEVAQRAATTELEETRKTTGTISGMWKAIDTMTNEIVASETFRLTDSFTDVRRASSQGGNSNESSSSSRTQGLINGLIDQGVEKVITRIGQSMEKIPFRAQIVRVDKRGVILNAGKGFGLEAGDTFAVRRIDTSLIDPATGRSLAGPGTLEGLIRVTNVSDQTAEAVVMESAGKLTRGDLLEWVGIFK